VNEANDEGDEETNRDEGEKEECMNICRLTDARKEDSEKILDIGDVVVVGKRPWRTNCA